MNRKRILKMVGILTFLGIIYYLNVEPYYTPTALSTPNAKFLLPRFIAHKSILGNQSKGNSLNDIKAALESAVDGIELDVRLSKDKVPFIYHADFFETESETYRAEDLNWADLKSKLISLDEALQLVGTKKYLFLDIKENRVFNSDFAKELHEIIEKHNAYDTVVVESFNPAFLTHVRLASRDIIIMYDFLKNSIAMGEESQEQLDSIPWILKQTFFQKQFRRILRPDVLGPRWNIEGAYISELVSRGYPIISWTVDDSNIASKLFELGVTGIQSNQPIKLINSLSPEMQRKIMDAGGTQSNVQNLYFITNESDVINAYNESVQNKKQISIAGKRHSMGGQSLLSNSTHLSMLGFNQVSYNPQTLRVRVQSGATWKEVQRVLDLHQRSVKIMQSDNIFSVGGSVSVNVHGWQVNEPPLGSSVCSMRVLTADGSLKTITLNSDPKLFKAFIGGYGQFGVILEVELETTENSLLKQHYTLFPSKQFEEKFTQNVSHNPNVELAYGRLSIDQNNLLSESILVWYESVSEKSNQKFTPERFVAIKRAIFRISEYLDIGKRFRWAAEKTLVQYQNGSVQTRNTVMNTDAHVIWPLWPGRIDILQEYFIPKGKMNVFIDILRKVVKKHHANLLNITIREVKKDTISALPFAKEDAFAFVLLFSQTNDAPGEYAMESFTKELIHSALTIQGSSFYLPYRPHYTWQELNQAYPMLSEWLLLKQKLDPDTRFSSEFMKFIADLKGEKSTP